MSTISIYDVSREPSSSISRPTECRDKSGTFSDQISVHSGSPTQNVLKSDLKKWWISRICGLSDILRSQPDIFDHVNMCDSYTFAGLVTEY